MRRLAEQAAAAGAARGPTQTEAVTVPSPSLDVLHRRPAQGRAARPPGRLGLAADRRPARGTSPRRRAQPTPRRWPAYFQFDDFAHFISIYLSVVKLVETAEDVRLLTYEIGREMAGQQIRYAELTITPYLSVERPAAGRGVPGGDRGRADRRRARLRRPAALDLRHPGRLRRPGRGDDRLDRAGPPRPRAGRARHRRVGAGLPAVDVRRAVRPGPGVRAALGPARRRDHRPGDDLGRGRRTSAPSASSTASPPSRTPT